LFVAVFGDVISKTQGKEVYIDVSMFLPCLKVHGLSFPNVFDEGAS
jgi:hypothetical protein